VKLADRAEWSNAEISVLRRLSLRLTLAGIVVAAAAAREESRGGHVRTQHPERHDGKWLATTRAIWREDGVALDHSERVRTEIVKPEE
jgi:succinate dehydrogenase/fumarate reductase flavoprotein subunit